MAKSGDKETKDFLAGIINPKEGLKREVPAFEKFRTSWQQGISDATLFKHSPETLINAARTQEELFLIQEHLQKRFPNQASGQPWWDLYHQRRLSLSSKPSFYGTDKTGKGLWGATVNPQEYVRKHASSQGLQGRSISRHLYGGFASWEQITGQQPLLTSSAVIKAPKLPNLPSNALFFDFETTGLLKKDSSIISYGFLDSAPGTKSSPTSLFAEFERTKTFSPQVEKTIIPQWEKASKGQKLLTEKQLITQFVEHVEKPKTALFGYNIKQFDLPMAFETAQKYNLEGRLQKALKSTSIVDVAEHSMAFLSSQLSGKVVGWEAGMVSELGLNPLGWQLEAVAKGLGYAGTSGAHEASEDVRMTKFVWEQLQDKEKAAKAFNYKTWKGTVEGLTKQTIQEVPTNKIVDYSRVMAGKTEEYYSKPFAKQLVDFTGKRAARAEKVVQEATETVFSKPVSGKTGKVLGGITGKATLGSALSYGASFAGMSMIMPGDFWQNMFSSTGWEAARLGAKHTGYGGWKQWAAAAGGAAVANILWTGAANAFSGKDDAYNTIEGLRHGGMAEDIRRKFTEFGSGYQGPNPWLNPAYNEAEDVPRYTTMRASQLGKSEKEIYNWYTKRDNPSEFLAASANAGTALHLVEEAKAVQSGRVQAAEEFLYDPQTGITGHIDLTYPSGAPADIKTVSDKRFRQVEKYGAFKKHIHQLNWYMHQKNTQSGFLEYVSRDDTSKRITTEISFSEKMLQEDVEKVKKVQERVRTEIASGKLDPSMLPGAASIERLQGAAQEDIGEAERNIEKIPELEKVFQEEMEYLNTVKAKTFNAPFQQRFSGKDDNYNTIEGLRHGGMAQGVRRSLTDFGSGYQGLEEGIGAAEVGSAINSGLMIGMAGLTGWDRFGVKGALGGGVIGAGLAFGSSFLQFENKEDALGKKLWNGVLEGIKSSATTSMLASSMMKGTLLGKLTQKSASFKTYMDNMGSVLGKELVEAGGFYGTMGRAGAEGAQKIFGGGTAGKIIGKGIESITGSPYMLDSVLKHGSVSNIPVKEFFTSNAKDVAAGTLGGAALSFPVTIALSLFSGKDDDYNTIEGLRHGGMAEQTRKNLTDFGSGYQGGKEESGGSGFLGFLGITAALGITAKYGSKIRSLVTGRTQFFHGTTKKAAKSIRQEGLLAKHAAKAGSTTDELLFKKGNFAKEDFQGLTYIANTKFEGKVYANQAAGLEAGRDIAQIRQEYYKAYLPGSKGDLVKFDVPLWKKPLNRGPNPEIAPYKDIDEYLKYQNDQLEAKGFSRDDPVINKAFRKQYKILKGQNPVKGDIGTEFIRGSKDFNSLGIAELKEYITANPVDFVKGTAATAGIAGLGVYSFSSMFSGKDDAYNTIEGLRHGGMAEGVRRDLTEFGSGWDPLRKIASKIFGEKKGVFKKLVKTEKFQEALLKGKAIKELGEGKWGRTYLMQGKVEGKDFQYVMKQAREDNPIAPFVLGKKYLAKEAKALEDISGEILPSYYGYSAKSNKLFMEYLPGKQLTEAQASKLPKEALGVMREQIKRIAEKGYVNVDIHPGNILYQKATATAPARLSWIDFGLAAQEQEWKSFTKSPVTKAMSPEMLMRQALSKNIKSSETNALQQRLNAIKKPDTIPPNTTMRKQAKKRIQNFRKITEGSVGIGLKSAHNATKGSKRFHSTGV